MDEVENETVSINSNPNVPSNTSTAEDTRDEDNILMTL